MRRLLGLVVALALLPGCYSKITAYEGNFTIGYMSPLNQVENFVKPIAPGAKLDLVVFANGTTNKLTIVEATSSKRGVLEVVEIKGETLVVRGVAPGATELTIVAKTFNGERVTDKMFFHVAKPATHGLEHMCTEQPKAAYVRGTEVVIFHRMATADNRPVVGYDYVPLTMTPSNALDFVAQPQAGTIYRYRATKAVPSVTIESNIDGKSVEARIVERSDIKTGELWVPGRMIAGARAYAVAHVRLPGGAEVCSQNALTRARSLTPEVCTVTARLDDSLDETNREQLAEITAVKFGTCQVEVTLPELGDRGLVLKQSIEIGRVEYPSGHSEAADVADRNVPRRFPMWPLWIFLGFAQVLGLSLLARRRLNRE